MRIKNTIKNSLYSIICYMITTILLFWSRRLFLDNLSVEFLGYDSLFKEVLAFVSLADLGIGGAITYRMYEVVARGDQKQVVKMMNMYRYIYLALAGLILFFGLCMIPLLPLFIKNTQLSFPYICLIYCLQLLGTGSSYLLGYNRIRFQAEQKEYVTVKIDLFMNVIAQLLRIIVLLTVSNYIVYVMVTIVQNVGANVWIACKYRTTFGKDEATKIKKQDIQQLELLKDFKNFIFHKIASIVYGGTDNIVISSILGVSKVALFTNYTLVANQLNAVIDKLFQPLIASIADLIYKESREKAYYLFRGLDFLFFLIGTYLCVGISSIIQSFVSLWLGKQYLQNYLFVYLITCNVYIVWAHKVLVLFRSTMGHFEEDRKYMNWSAIINLSISIVLGRYFGFSGIMLGTVLGHLCIWYGRMKVVFHTYFKMETAGYIKDQVKRFTEALLICGVCIFITRELAVSWWGMIIKGILVTIIYVLYVCVLFRKSEEVSIIVEYLKKIRKLRG